MQQKGFKKDSKAIGNTRGGLGLRSIMVGWFYVKRGGKGGKRGEYRVLWDE